VKNLLRRTPRLAALTLFACAGIASAGTLPDHVTVTKALREVVAEQNGGFGFQMWATIVDRDGIVRVVAMSGKERGDQWPGSRVISAQKANTANAFSLPGLSIATGNLYFATQPGGSLFGLQHSNPIDPTVAYSTSPALYGTANDPMVTKAIGGVNVFGGGLALYDEKGALLGGLGLSGDSSVADHVIAWKLRKKLGLDYVPGGVSATKDDNLVIDIADGKSPSGWGHAATTPEATKIVNELPTTHPISKRK
jgi:uncharacterized protein GlcG (DUF336 family)